MTNKKNNSTKISSSKIVKAGYKTEILTGVRPTGGLTVANYLGAIEPIVKLQNQGRSPLVFVADIHALTDNEPSVVKKFVGEVVADYIALGVNPKKTKIFKQSDIEEEVAILTAFLSRLISVAELLRVPTLKDKLKATVSPETANTLLLLYPVMMAADILLQRAKKVPVGEDQLAHIEVARELARRFNKKYGEVFLLPDALQLKSLRVLSLKGGGKMSKSLPEGAIFFTDSAETVARKIKSAETAFEGAMNERLESHILIAKSLSKNNLDKKEIDAVIRKHKQGEAVMGRFKQIFTRIVQNFLKEFQVKKAKAMENPQYISSVLEEGALIAKANAKETIRLIKQAMYHN